MYVIVSIIMLRILSTNSWVGFHTVFYIDSYDINIMILIEV